MTPFHDPAGLRIKGKPAHSPRRKNTPRAGAGRAPLHDSAGSKTKGELANPSAVRGQALGEGEQGDEGIRPRTFAEKALARKAGKTGARAGDILEVRPDRILTHDNTAAIAQIFYKELGAERVQDPSRLLIVLDHASPPPTPTHAQIHAEARAFVRAQGVRDFFDIGRGICHQVAAEEALLLPGQVILGADSHTTHHGWMGAFGAGVGRSEAAALWATGGLWLRVPHSVRFTLQGSLASGVTTKDLCLAIIGELGADGGLYLSAEFDGPGLRTLSIDSRMVIPNMMAEFGVKNACLAPDEAVFEYLASRGSGRASRADCEASALWADPGAEYLAEYEIDLSAVGPLAAAPHGVDRRQTLSEAAGKPIDMAFLGTCTNGRLEDLRAAAQAVAGKKVRPGTRFLVVPASVEVYRAAVAEGIIGALVDSGAMIGVPGCGPCMGNHLGIPAAGEVVFSTANRNFKGRMGQPDAEIHLGSPALVALGAVLGRIPSPREFEDIPHPASPSSSIPALREGKRRAKAREGMRADSFLRLVRGTDLRKFGPQSPSPSPSIPPLREGRRWEKGSEGMRADAFVADGSAWVYGGDINTDRIFPGKYTYTLRTPEEIAAHALEDLDPEFLRASKPGDVIFAGRNMGCGSSREQAVTCLTGRGVRAVVAESFGRIFYRNAINRGLPAIVCPEAVAAAHRGDPVKVDLERGEILLPAGRFAYPPFPESVRALLAAGGLIRYLKTKGK